MPESKSSLLLLLQDAQLSIMVPQDKSNVLIDFFVYWVLFFVRQTTKELDAIQARFRCI